MSPKVACKHLQARFKKFINSSRRKHNSDRRISGIAEVLCELHELLGAILESQKHLKKNVDEGRIAREDKKGKEQVGHALALKAFARRDTAHSNHTFRDDNAKSQYMCSDRVKERCKRRIRDSESICGLLGLQESLKTFSMAFIL